MKTAITGRILFISTVVAFATIGLGSKFPPSILRDAIMLLLLVASFTAGTAVVAINLFSKS